MPTILFQNNDFAIARKAHNIPTVPLKTQSPNGTLLGLVQIECPQILSVQGKNPWEYGALHRLDTATAGLVLFAKTQSFYDYMINIQNKDLFEKTYIALTTKDTRLKGFESPNNRTFKIQSYFRSYGKGAKEVRPTLDIKKADSKTLYTTECLVIDGGYQCKITKGFRHQIRAHLAWIGNPIKGDKLYGNTQEKEQDLQLKCIEISFPLYDGTIFKFKDK